MKQLTSALVGLILLFSFPFVALGEHLPRPEGLNPQIEFWKRIYGEVDTNGGLIHDARRLDIVYEKLEFPAKASQRSKNRLIENAKKKYAAALRTLGRGKRTGLSNVEKQVLSLWGEGVSNATLRTAAGRLRFQLGQSDKFRAGLIRAGAWRPYIDQIFAEYGIPPEVAALPHVESSFNPTAYSRIGAAGLWQFTRSTGKRFLTIDYAVDERLDPFKSSVAAAKLLQSNYRELGSWPLAVTAYNHGVGGMSRATRQLGTQDIVEIINSYQSRIFGFASRNFYTELLAAHEVEQNAETYFGKLPARERMEFQSVELGHYHPVEALTKAFGISMETLREYNPSLRPPVFTGQKYVPKSYTLHLPPNFTQVAVADAISSIPNSQRFDKQHRDKYYRVQRGDTLSTIARRVDVRERELIAANNLRNRHFIRVGQVLLLPGSAKSPTPSTLSIAQAPVHSGPLPSTYKVRAGDTLSSIAEHFDIELAELLDANALRNRNRIYAGQVLALPGTSTPPSIQIAENHEPTPALTEEDAAVTVALTEEDAAVTVALAEEDAAVTVALTENDEQTPDLTPIEVPASLAEAEEDSDAIQETEQEPDVIAEPPPPVASPSPEEAGVRLASFDTTSDRYAVREDGFITVEAEETVGHYADWLKLSASHLRKLNRMSFSTPLVLGRRFRLDFSRVSREDFEQARMEYHRSLQEDFFSAYQVASTSEHKLKRGETLWSISRGEEPIPIWLLIQYNPEIDFNALHPGMRVTLPRIEPRQT